MPGGQHIEPSRRGKVDSRKGKVCRCCERLCRPDYVVSDYREGRLKRWALCSLDCLAKWSAVEYMRMCREMYPDTEENVEVLYGPSR